ncbi:hypothetical protein HDF24_09345 [Mucilaginibacter sp. X4EP1]|uniref:hypothetical protein n=1 Tax=Mucilaginibacter sp. X4EP1 TaxID=2723092 RepID=UPI002167804E|nr:hypothetical protein [Mucilaginibacter sp. X4EP1]MCS3813878.1 hypothetical protein [Mucilaginibacter sp. X4EP1]
MKFNNSALIGVITLAITVIAGCKKQDLQATKNSTPINKSNLSLVPGVGYVPQNQVHIIEAGNQLTVKNGHILKVEKASGKLVEDFGAIQIGSLNRSVNSGTTNSQQRNLSSKPGSISGANPNWITWAQWTNTGSQPINYFSTTWSVPTAPTSNDGQTLFIFNGLETTSGSDILQPVLQWGTSAAGGGSYWAIANWFVASGFYAVQMPLITVSAHTSLQGIMTYTGQQAGSGSYDYTSSFSGYSNALTLVDGGSVDISSGTTPYVPLQTTTVETLEAYSSSGGTPVSPSDYPPDFDVAMTNIQGQTASGNVSFSWLAQNNVTGFGQQAVVVSNSSPGGEVDLYFSTPIAEIDMSLNDSTYYWSKLGTVTSGTTTNYLAYRSQAAYTLPTGETPNSIIGVAIASNNWCYYYYSDGKMSVGTSVNASYHSGLASYSLPSGETVANILSISIAKNSNNVYTWYKDGTASVGSFTSLGSVRSPYAYTVAAGETISNVVGIAIAGTDSHVFAWYKDLKVSEGDSNQFDYYAGTISASF